jgi:uncharacterized protein YjfI (DUF2170 family)
MQTKKTSTFYMEQRRTGLRASGYVPKEVWVLPENKKLLAEIEITLRQPYQAGAHTLEMQMTAVVDKWTITRLFDALTSLEMVTSEKVATSIVQGADQAIKLEMLEFGSLPIFMAVMGDQIIVDTLLIEASEIEDKALFNDAVLRSRDLFPLSSIGLETLPDGTAVYSMFGALSAESSLTNVVTEIETLVENVQRATQALSHFFK